MKNTAKLLIIAAAVITLIGIVSRLSITPFGGIASRAMIGFAGLLLLFAIALEGLK
jgi:hypothetical protein